MNRHQQEDLIESQADIIEAMRAILVQEGDDSAILREARITLSDWYIATYPHLFPDQSRVHLRLVKGEGRRSRSARQAPLLSSVEEP